MIPELHRRLKGRPWSEQVALLFAAALADVDREAMDELASDVRVGPPTRSTRSDPRSGVRPADSSTSARTATSSFTRGRLRRRRARCADCQRRQTSGPRPASSLIRRGESEVARSYTANGTRWAVSDLPFALHRSGAEPPVPLPSVDSGY
jgi:hypothetical protein